MQQTPGGRTIIHIEHIAIWAKDIERLKSFYVEFFGAFAGPKYWNQNHQFESYFLSFGTGPRIEIMHMPSIPNSANDPREQFTGLVHIAFSAGSRARVDELTHMLDHAGYCIAEYPRTTGDGYYESCVLDPEGNRFEITV